MNTEEERKDRLFMTAEWRKLAMINYVVDPDIIRPFLPPKTELDLWEDRCYVSLVGFMFQNIRIKGVSVPFHRNFEEVNLRFYVRYQDAAVWKRGVVFLREFVPLPMVSFIANNLYEERYRTVRMNHRWSVEEDSLTVDYSWRKSQWHEMSVTARNTSSPIASGTEEEFITQHFWGYSQKKHFLSEYEVAHERWSSYPVDQYGLGVDFGQCYGPAFSFLDKLDPYSVYLVEGSPVSIYRDRKIF